MKKKLKGVSAITGDRATIFSSHPLYPALAHIAILERTVVQLRAQNDAFRLNAEELAGLNRELQKQAMKQQREIAKLKAKRK